MTPEERSVAIAADKAIRHNDEYSKATRRQGEGLPCWRCRSFWGHFVHCPLINGGVVYTEKQRAILKQMGLAEDEGWSFNSGGSCIAIANSDGVDSNALPSRHETWCEWNINRVRDRQARFAKEKADLAHAAKFLAAVHEKTDAQLLTAKQIKIADKKRRSQ